MDCSTTPKEACLHNLRKLQDLHLMVPGSSSLAGQLPYLSTHFLGCLKQLCVR